jgi:hypothetical protein
MGMQDGCKVYMDLDTASNGSCFMVTSLTIDRVVASMTLKVKNINYSEMPPEVVMSKDFLI